MQNGLFGIFVLCLALVLSACEERATPPPPVSDEKIKILATVYPLASIAREIGGDYVQVEWIVESGQALPGDDAAENVTARARSADFVLSDGEAWAVRGYDDPLRAARIIRLDTLQSAASTSPTPGLRWLDPAVAREVAQELYKRLSAHRPKLDPYFRARTQRFLDELEGVSRQYVPVLETDPPRTVLVLSTDWMRLLNRHKMQPLCPVQGNPSSLSPPQIRQIVEAARAARVTAMFVHADTPPSVISDLQNRTDLTVMTLDALGSSAGVGRNSYVEILKYNLNQLNHGASRASW